MLTLERLRLRAAFFRLIRSFFNDRGFLEVDTPIRQPVNIPESNIVPIESEGQYLQTSPELCMKRLLAAGSGDIFQICHCFRKEEHGRLHLDEFQMLEWYRIDADYTQLMDDCEELFRYLFAELREMLAAGTLAGKQLFQNVTIAGAWQRISVGEAFKKYSPLSLDLALGQNKFDELLVEYIEPKLGINTPVFLYDYPVELGSLARKKPGNPEIAERFELYLNGVELANGFSELTDVGEQRRRFSEEITSINLQHGRIGRVPERFLDDLVLLDRAAGIALGLDRLLMIAVGESEIARVATFGPVDFM